MIEPVLFPDVEALLVRVLGPLLGVPVLTRVPKDRPTSFVRVTRVGGTVTNIVTDSALVVVECWAGREPDAAELGGRTRAYVFALAGDAYDGDFVRRVREVGGLQRFPDPESGSPRYQFTVQIDTRGEPLT